MAFKDILLTLTSYPDPTPVTVAEEAVSIAATLGAHLAAVACEVHVEVPGHFLSGSIANVPGIIAGETEKSRRSAQEMLAAFDAAADKAGVPHETHLEKCVTYDVPDVLVEYARLRDLTIVPVPESYDQWYAEALIFGSGRPTLVLPEAPRPRPFALGTVAVAWDFSRTAARAWWREHATFDRAIDAWRSILAEAVTVAPPPRPANWPRHLTADGTERARDLVDQFGCTVDFLSG